MPPPPLAGNAPFYARKNAAIPISLLSGHISLPEWKLIGIAVIADMCRNPLESECMYG